MRETIMLPLDDVSALHNKIFCLNTENDRLKDELNGYKDLIDKLNLIALDKVSEAIDMQDGGKSDE